MIENVNYNCFVCSILFCHLPCIAVIIVFVIVCIEFNFFKTKCYCCNCICILFYSSISKQNVIVVFL